MTLENRSEILENQKSENIPRRSQKSTNNGLKDALNTYDHDRSGVSAFEARMAVVEKFFNLAKISASSRFEFLGAADFCYEKSADVGST